MPEYFIDQLFNNQLIPLSGLVWYSDSYTLDLNKNQANKYVQVLYLNKVQPRAFLQHQLEEVNQALLMIEYDLLAGLVDTKQPYIFAK